MFFFNFIRIFHLSLHEIKLMFYLKFNIMKKLIVTFSVLAIVAIMVSSCGKQCYCTRFEDGKKIATYTDKDVVYFESSVCENNSVSSYQGESIVTEDKEVSIEIKCK